MAPTMPRKRPETALGWTDWITVALSILSGALNVLDGILTFLLLRRQRGKEANPMMAALIDRFGDFEVCVIGKTIFGIFLTTSALVIFYYINNQLYNKYTNTNNKYNNNTNTTIINYTKKLMMGIFILLTVEYVYVCYHNWSLL